MYFHPLKCKYYKKNKLYEEIVELKKLKELKRNDYEILFELDDLNNDMKKYLKKDKLTVGDVLYDESNNRIWIFSFFKNNNYSLTNDEDIINHASAINGFGFICYKERFQPYKYELSKYRELKNPLFIGNVFLKVNVDKKYKSLVNKVTNGSADYKSLRYFNLNVEILYYSKNYSKKSFNPYYDNDKNKKLFFSYRNEDWQIKLTKTYRDNFFSLTEKRIYPVIELLQTKEHKNKYIVNELISFTGNFFYLNNLFKTYTYLYEIAEIVQEKQKVFLKKDVDKNDILKVIDYHSQLFLILNKDGCIEYMNPNYIDKPKDSYDILTLLQPNRRIIYTEIEFSFTNEYYVREFLKII